MKNLWPEEFNSKDIKPVKAILEEQAKLLPKITGDMVHASVKKMRGLDALKYGHENYFSYSFYLMAKFIQGYSFKILDFSHPITIYPAKVFLDELIADELQCEKHFEVSNEDEFISILSKVLNSERIKDVIGSIIRLSSDQ